MRQNILYPVPEAPAINVEVFLTSAHLENEDLRNRTVVVIDVLRACSTIVTALHHGARAVVPVADMAQAGRLAQNLNPNIYVLGGERGGRKIEGYHLGNSPQEYTRERVKGRDVILNTTNGTTALARARSARHLVAGCFLNADRVVDFIREQGDDVTLVCAGKNNRLSLEDTLCAGLFLHRLWRGREPDADAMTDTSHVAFSQYLRDSGNPEAALRHSLNARHLAAMGLEADIAYCLQTNALPVLPYYKDSRLTLYTDSERASVSSGA